MKPTKSQINFTNQIYLALHGETIEEAVKRKEQEKAAIEKSISIQKLIKQMQIYESSGFQCWRK